MSTNAHEMRPGTSGYASGMLRREREDDSCEYDVFSKRQRCSDAYLFPDYSDLSGDESVYSMQGWETAYVQDTPDISSHEEESDDTSDFRSRLSGHLATIEYEADSFSEAENPFGKSDSGDSSSGDNDSCARAKDVEDNKTEEEAFWGDDSHSDTHTTSTDQEISPCDFWTCLRCKCINKPIPRYCRKCFQVRKNWFPPRPRQKRKKSKCRQRAKNLCVDNNDSGLGSFSKEHCGNECGETPSTSAVQGDLPKCNTNETKDTNVVYSLANEKCITCMQELKNTAFVHGNVAHICCCYRCAKKAWSNSGKCPVCNRKANRVVKVFVA